MFNRKLKEQIATLEAQIGREKEKSAKLKTQLEEGRGLVREFADSSIPKNELKERGRSWLTRSSGL